MLMENFYTELYFNHKNGCIVTNQTDKYVCVYIFPHPGPGVVYQPLSESGCNLLGSAQLNPGWCGGFEAVTVQPGLAARLNIVVRKK